jgi:nucleoside-diphosphate-sugar epimerase
LEGDPEPLLKSEVLILNVPPKTRAGADPQEHLEQLRGLLPYVEDSPVQWVVFVSSTGVYPNLNRIVAEGDEPSPEEENAHVLVGAEQLFMQSKAFDTTIVRPGGLIGPDRHPARYFAGKEGIRHGLNPVNLIHLEDLLRLIHTILQQNVRNDIFNAVAAEHPSRAEYYTTVAKQMGYTLPGFEEETGPWKQVSSEKARRQLGFEFHKGLDPA